MSDRPIGQATPTVAELEADLEAAVKLVLAAGLSTGHADTCADLMEEVLSQFKENKNVE